MLGLRDSSAQSQRLAREEQRTNKMKNEGKKRVSDGVDEKKDTMVFTVSSFIVSRESFDVVRSNIFLEILQVRFSLNSAAQTIYAIVIIFFHNVETMLSLKWKGSVRDRRLAFCVAVANTA